MAPSHWRMMGTSKITNLIGQLLATVMSKGFLARLSYVKLYLGGLLVRLGCVWQLTHLN